MVTHASRIRKKPQKKDKQTRQAKQTENNNNVLSDTPLSIDDIQRIADVAQTGDINPNQILQLQREYGNKFVLQLMRETTIQRGVQDLLSQFESGSVSNSTGTQTNDKGIRGGDVSSLTSQHEESIEDSTQGSAPMVGPQMPAQQTETNRNRRLHGHEIAIRQHDVDRNALTTWLQEARSQDTDRRLKNSAEWILKGKTLLYAITQTGDSDMRISEAGMNPKEDAAFFPKGDGGPGHVLDAPIDYNWQDITDNTNIVLDEDGKVTEGWNGAGYIAITDPIAKGKDAVWETIKHEVQHDSDQHRDKQAAVPDGSVEQALESYKTEYRAYNYEGGKFEQYNGDPDVNWLGYDWTAKQAEIFEDIWDGYSHTRWLWDPTDPDPMTRNTPRDKNDVFDDVAFGPNTVNMVEDIRQKIINYVNPDSEGFNKYNSVRVDAYYQALNAAPDGHNTRYRPDALDGAPQHIQDIVAAIRKLDSDDANYILGEAADYEKLLNAKYTRATTRNTIRGLIRAQR